MEKTNYEFTSFTRNPRFVYLATEAIFPSTSSIPTHKPAPSHSHTFENKSSDPPKPPPTGLDGGADREAVAVGAGAGADGWLSHPPKSSSAVTRGAVVAAGVAPEAQPPKSSDIAGIAGVDFAGGGAGADTGAGAGAFLDAQTSLEPHGSSSPEGGATGLEGAGG